MTEQLNAPTDSLKLRRIFKASRERVFEAWTQPHFIRQWLGGESSQPLKAEIDLRTGGQYRIQIHPQGRQPFWVIGTYHEVIVPEKLVFSWLFEGNSPETNETLVTVEFNELHGETEVILFHQKFQEIEFRDLNQMGWTSCLESLATLLETS